MDKEFIHCEDCIHSFKCKGSKTGYACEVWGHDDFSCDVPLDGYCHKAVSRKYEIGKDMDFNKPIYAEAEDNVDANEIRKYLINHGIEFKEVTDDYKFIGDYHVFECIMTKEQMLEVNKNTPALLYQ